MKKMKKLWNTWKAMVDTHNAKFSYVNYEEAWDYTTIFNPLIMGIVAFLFIGVVSFKWGIAAFYGLLFTVIMGVAYFINWKVNA